MDAKPARRFCLRAASAAALASIAPRLRSQASLPRVAYVWLFNEGPSGPYNEAFQSRMEQLGWVDGRTVRIEYHNAGGDSGRLDAAMRELVRSKVDVIVATCTPEAQSSRKFTQTIPVVLAATGDPVAAGFAQSLGRPGGNITGVSSMSLSLSARRVALLKESFPRLNHATVLWNPVRKDNEPEVRIMQETASRLGLQLESAPFRSSDELATLIDALGWGRTQAVLNAGDNVISTFRRQLVERAAALRMPAMYEDRIFVEAGGLMSYGPNLRDQHRRAADYVDRILRGAKPAEMPIEQPTRFELVVNEKAARAIGVKLPQVLLLQASQVIA
jgi:putative tryptophan/tyrosine transport system substrate-binding protein